MNETNNMSVRKGNVSITDVSDVNTIVLNDDHSNGLMSFAVNIVDKKLLSSPLVKGQESVPLIINIQAAITQQMSNKDIEILAKYAISQKGNVEYTCNNFSTENIANMNYSSILNTVGLYGMDIPDSFILTHDDIKTVSEASWMIDFIAKYPFVPVKNLIEAYKTFPSVQKTFDDTYIDKPYITTNNTSSIDTGIRMRDIRRVEGYFEYDRSFYNNGPIWIHSGWPFISYYGESRNVNNLVIDGSQNNSIKEKYIASFDCNYDDSNACLFWWDYWLISSSWKCSMLEFFDNDNKTIALLVPFYDGERYCLLNLVDMSKHYQTSGEMSYTE